MAQITYLRFIICIALLPICCAYPKEAKDLSKEQLQLQDEFDATAKRFQQSLALALEKNLSLGDKSYVTKEALKRINKTSESGMTEDILEKQNEIIRESKRAEENDTNHQSARDSAEKATDKLKEQFTVLHAQIRLMAEGQKALDDFINIDITPKSEDVKKLLQTLEEIQKIQEKQKEQKKSRKGHL
ncbi:MAG: hypothetical protein QMD05_07970 [Candidatus Brocadiaceae bacterium]|nr:hypothetical protein [Candidatus Brocadiaceae bacterium]